FYDFQVQSFVWNKSLGMMSHDFCVCFMQHVGLDLVTKDAI
ncbi:unnamed protein product, partial [Brassica rapa]